jgi:DNA-binding GntR family transcriptional regulator
MTPLKSRGLRSRVIPSREPLKRLARVRQARGQNDGNRQLRAYDAIRLWILDATYKAGTPLSEYELAKELGVSRTPVREALKRLQQERLVRSVPRRGTFVSEMAVHDIIEIYEVRDMLEVPAASAAAERMDSQLAQRLRKEIEEVRRATGSRKTNLARREDLSLHKAIIAAVSNRRFAEILSTLDAQVHRIRTQMLADEARLSSSLNEHSQIVDAIIARNARAAGDAMRSHLRAARENAVHAALSRSGTDPAT